MWFPSFKFNWCSQSHSPSKFVRNSPILHGWQLKTSTHTRSSLLNPTRLQSRAREPGTAGTQPPRLVELSRRPGAAAEPRARLHSCTLAAAGDTQTPACPSPEPWPRAGHASNPGRRQSLGPRQATQRLHRPPSPSTAHPHGPPYPGKPAPRGFQSAQVRRALSRPGSAARPRPPGTRAAPEWAGGTSVRRRGRGPGAPVPPPGYNVGPRRAAGGGWRCAPGQGWGWGRAELLAAARGGGSRTGGREGGRGGRWDGGHSGLPGLHSHQLPKVLLPTFTSSGAASGGARGPDGTALSRAGDRRSPSRLCSQLCYLYSSPEHGLRPPLARAAAALGGCAGLRLPPPGRDGSVFEERGPKLQFYHSLTQCWEVCER